MFTAIHIAVACAIISTVLQALRTIMHHRDRMERRSSLED